MRQSSDLKGQLSVSDRRNVGQRLAGFLRDLYPRDTAKLVAVDTGISASCIQKILERESVPNGLALIAMAVVYGPDFLVAVFPSSPPWLDKAYRAEQQKKLEMQAESIRLQLEELGR